MKVYRIEHKTGYGMFTAEENGKCVLESSYIWKKLKNKHGKFPNIYNDNFNKSFTPNHFCAFKSLNQLKYWVKKEWRQELRKYGFQVYEIKVIDKDLCIGKFQIGYTKNDVISKTILTC